MLEVLKAKVVKDMNNDPLRLQRLQNQPYSENRQSNPPQSDFQHVNNVPQPETQHNIPTVTPTMVLPASISAPTLPDVARPASPAASPPASPPASRTEPPASSAASPAASPPASRTAPAASPTVPSPTAATQQKTDLVDDGSNSNNLSNFQTKPLVPSEFQEITPAPTEVPSTTAPTHQETDLVDQSEIRNGTLVTSEIRYDLSLSPEVGLSNSPILSATPTVTVSPTVTTSGQMQQQTENSTGNVSQSQSSQGTYWDFGFKYAIEV